MGRHFKIHEKSKKRRRLKIKHSDAFWEKLEAKQDTFLESMRRNNCIQTIACRDVNIAIDTVIDWRERYPRFNRKFLQVYASLPVIAESEAIRRAIKGYQGRPIVHEGRVVREITEYSDTLLKSVLAAHDKRYRTGDVDLGLGATTGEFSITIKAHPGTPAGDPEKKP